MDKKFTVTRMASLVMVGSVSLVVLLNLLRMAGWLATTWWFNGLVIVFGVVAMVAMVVRYFARRALPRLPLDRNRGHFDGKN